MCVEELIERLERAGIDPAFNDEVIAALREQMAEIEKLTQNLQYTVQELDKADAMLLIASGQRR